MTCVPSENSDQPVWSVFAFLQDSLGPWVIATHNDKAQSENWSNWTDA